MLSSSVSLLFLSSFTVNQVPRSPFMRYCCTAVAVVLLAMSHVVESQSLQQVMQAFEMTPPVLGPGGTIIGAGRPVAFPDDIAIDPDAFANDISCTVRLVDNVFANSFEQPALFDYTPPDCIGDANTAVTNLTVQTIGRQFDRLSFVLVLTWLWPQE